jgi:phenylalanyl-tRNA synthetase alpha chain
MDVEDLMDELSLLEKRVLLAFGETSSAPPEELMKRGGFDELVEVMNAASWLQSKGLVSIEEKVKSYYSLAKKQWATKSLPERRALKALRKARGRMDLDTLQKSARLSPKETQIAIGWMKRKAWATVDRPASEEAGHCQGEGEGIAASRAFRHWQGVHSERSQDW